MLCLRTDDISSADLTGIDTVLVSFENTGADRLMRIHLRLTVAGGEGNYSVRVRTGGEDGNEIPLSDGGVPVSKFKSTATVFDFLSVPFYVREGDTADLIVASSNDSDSSVNGSVMWLDMEAGLPAGSISGEVDDETATAEQFVTSLTAADDDFYNNETLVFLTGNLAGQARRIIDYDGDTSSVKLFPPLTEPPANSDTFLILPWAYHASSGSPADNPVDITINDTDGNPLDSVCVWVGIGGNRNEAIVSPAVTGPDGKVMFYLVYGVEYSLYCYRSGYSFEQGSAFTPEEGAASFSFNIGQEAEVTGGTYNYEDGFLTRAIAATRRWIDEPAINKKWSDDEIISQLEQAYADVMGDLNASATAPIIGVVSLPSTKKGNYALPYHAGTIIAVYSESPDGKKLFYDSRGEYNPSGRMVWVEGNTIKLQEDAVPLYGNNLKVAFIPMGTARLHAGECSVSENGETVVLAAVPAMGKLDTHENAYVGCVLRILHADGDNNYVQERVISGYDRETRTATLDVALSPVPSAGDGSVYYEIAPAIYQGLDEVITMHTAAIIASSEGNIARAKAISAMYAIRKRTLRLTAAYRTLFDLSGHSDDYRNPRFMG